MLVLTRIKLLGLDTTKFFLSSVQATIQNLDRASGETFKKLLFQFCDAIYRWRKISVVQLVST